MHKFITSLIYSVCGFRSPLHFLGAVIELDPSTKPVIAFVYIYIHMCICTYASMSATHLNRVQA